MEDALVAKQGLALILDVADLQRSDRVDIKAVVGFILDKNANDLSIQFGDPHLAFGGECRIVRAHRSRQSADSLHIALEGSVDACCSSSRVFLASRADYDYRCC